MHGTHSIWVSNSTDVDNGTAKVPISEKLGLVSEDQPPKSGTSHLLLLLIVVAVASYLVSEMKSLWVEHDVILFAKYWG